MSTDVPTCPGPDAIEALALRPPGPGDTAHASLVAHVARCEECAAALRAARFANRFSRVLLGEEESAAESGASAALPVIPGYRVEREISRGAQGVVYEAVQLKSGQHVAVKLLHERGHASPTSGARFGREIQIAGALSHPGIVRLLDSMVLADGSDALIMERINGVALSRWLEGPPRPSREQIVEALASVGDALHHAHQRGVIHRDLKPTNILIDERGEARVLDFGIARWTDASRDARRVTLTGEFAGTLAYAAPEQVGEQRAAADIRSDVYALGVIAYEAMTGAMPYAVHGSLETTIWNIVHAEPARTTMQGLGTDLAIVLAKAIAKEPERRYQTAAEFARDLRHAMRGEAIDARRDSRIYMLRKSIRRHRFPVAIGAMIAMFALVMLVVLAVSNSQLSDALRESRIERLRTLAATGSRAKAEAILWDELGDVGIGSRDAMAGVWGGPLHLRRCVWAFMELQGAARCVRRDALGIPIGSRLLELHGGGMCFANKDGHISVLAPSGEVLRDDIRVTPGGQFLGMTPDARYALILRDWVLECWAVADGTAGTLVSQRKVVQPPAGSEVVVEMRNRVAAISEPGKGLMLVTVPEFEDIGPLPNAAAHQRVWISADSEAVVYLATDGTLREYSSSTMQEIWSHEFVPVECIEPTTTLTGGVRLMLNPGETRAVAMLPASTYVVDLTREGVGNRLAARGGVRSSAGMNPDGTIIALASFGDSRLRLFDAVTLEEVASFTGHDRTVGLFYFTAEGRKIATIDSSFDLRVWDAPGHGWRRQLSAATQHALDPAMSPDWRRVYFGSSDKKLVSIQVEGAASESRVVGPSLALTVACSADGAKLAYAALGPELTLIDADGGNLRIVEAVPGKRIQSVRFSPDGTHVAAGTFEGVVVTVRTSDGYIQARHEIDPVAPVASIRHVGKSGLLAVGARDGRVHMLDATTLKVVRVVEASPRQVRSIAVSPDAKTIAAVGDLGQISLVDVASGRVRISPRVSEDAIFCVSFHPKGDTILVGDRAGVVTVVDATSLNALAAFNVRAPVTSLTFDPTGNRMVVSAIGHALEMWDFSALAETLDAVRPK
jgi:serine/threonine protein kinase/WD40 repeat protein